MIATIKARSPLHRQQLQFGALMFGLQADKVDDVTIEVAYVDADKPARIVQQYGGEIVDVVTYKRHNEF